MTPERWERVKELFDAAQERPAERRLQFLAQECAGDDALYGEVEHLIKEYDRAGDFLSSPVWTKVAEPVRVTESGRLDSDDLIVNPDSSAALLKRGDVFADRYEIKGELGRGGFGIVYSAFDRGPLQRTVALKVIRFVTTEPSKRTVLARRRFLEEARVAGNLSHSNIATVFDVGESSGCVYMTQELAPGRDLRKTLAEAGHLPLRRTLAIARQICEGLAQAHARGVVHRDIKPGNLVVDAEDRVKITDFGLAQPPQSEDSSLHRVVAGTPGYMAPEQLRGERVDGRADIFAFGCVLYQMLTGRPPFEGTTTASIIEKTLYTFPPEPSRVREDLPHTLDRVVARAMRKDPDERYNNVTQLQQDLLNYEQFEYLIDAKIGANEIATALEARQCTLLVGLCLPVSPNEKPARTAESLIAGYLAERLSAPSTERSLSRLAQDLELERGRPEMLKYLTAAVRNPRVSPHEIIGRIARLQFPVVISTGYDTLLEEELGKVNRKVRRVVNCGGVPDDPAEADLLVRLFGTVESEASIVVTEDDLWRFFGAFNSLSDALKSHFARHHLLFVGYDPEDEGFRHLFAEIARLRVGITEGCYLATTDTALAAVRWAQRKGLRLIDAEPASFLSLLEETVIEKRRERRSPQEEASEVPSPDPSHKSLNYYLRRLFPGTSQGREVVEGRKEGPELASTRLGSRSWLRTVLHRFPAQFSPGFQARVRGVVERLPGRSRPLLFSLGLAAVVLVAALAAFLFSRPSPRRTPSPAVLPPGIVSLEVTPWAKLTEVRNLKTQHLENLTNLITPVGFPLPAGDYELVVEHPTYGKLAIPVHVEAGGQEVIRKSFPTFDPEQVLKGYQ